MRIQFPPIALLRAAACILLIAGPSAGCARHNPPTAPAPIAYPTVDTPVHTMQALVWAYEHRSLDLYETLFTDDYVFVFSQQDSAGNAYRNQPWGREDELAFATHLFVGGGSEPPADRITVAVTNLLTAFPDHRPGKNPGWHQEISAEFVLIIERAGSSLDVRGPANFYFVRGDSAVIPQDLVERGYRPDSTRWWIEGWEDGTISGTAVSPTTRPQSLRANPTRTATWGSIKVLYR